MEEVMEILQAAKQLERRYRLLTGKPLGVTGEIAEFEAAHLLGLELGIARQAGFDATELINGEVRRIQIKGRRIDRSRPIRGRVGSIDLRQPFDSVMLVLLDEDLEAFAIYEANRNAVVEALTRPGSKARNERGSLAIAQFKAISQLRWSHAQGMTPA
ncbi:DUF6998 domain-containing protein [Pseudomonas nicosulfuronedens]